MNSSTNMTSSSLTINSFFFHTNNFKSVQQNANEKFLCPSDDEDDDKLNGLRIFWQLEEF